VPVEERFLAVIGGNFEVINLPQKIEEKTEQKDK
jgi:hypothetical protein